jgi:hypothetical protein
MTPACRLSLEDYLIFFVCVLPHLLGVTISLGHHWGRFLPMNIPIFTLNNF